MNMATVGELLRKAREDKGLTLREIEKEIRVRSHLIRAIEHEDWTAFSSKVYITGIIRNYAKLVGVDPHKALAFFRRDYERREEVKFKRRTARKELYAPTRTIITAIVVGILLCFGGYFGYQVYLFNKPPEIVVTQPEETTFRNKSKITIEGRIDQDSTITIFGNRVYHDDQGMFRYDFSLKEGENNLVIEVIGANGKTSTWEKTYVLE